MAVRGGTSVIDFQHPKTCVVVDAVNGYRRLRPPGIRSRDFTKVGWLRGPLGAIGDRCPGGRGMISQQNRADVPREEREWDG